MQNQNIADASPSLLPQGSLHIQPKTHYCHRQIPSQSKIGLILVYIIQNPHLESWPKPTSKFALRTA